MKWSFCILSVWGLLFYSSHVFGCTIPKKTDSCISTISRTYLDIVENADSIVWCLLDPISTDSVCPNKMGEILLCKTDTLEERCNALRSTLTYPQSFAKNDMTKECTFLPDIAIYFFSEKGTITFSYSFYCDLCRFEKNGKYQDIDGDLIRKSIIQMACEIFPKDRYLRNLKRKEK